MNKSNVHSSIVTVTLQACLHSYQKPRREPSVIHTGRVIDWHGRYDGESFNSAPFKWLLQCAQHMIIQQPPQELEISTWVLVRWVSNRQKFKYGELWTSLLLCTSWSSGTGRFKSSMNSWRRLLSLAPYTKPGREVRCWSEGRLHGDCWGAYGTLSVVDISLDELLQLPSSGGSRVDQFGSHLLLSICKIGKIITELS